MTNVTGFDAACSAGSLPGMSAPFVRDRLAALRDASLFRDPPEVQTDDGVHGLVGGREATLFCSNDYLGLRLDSRVRAAAADAAHRYGAGSGSSRLIAGSLPIHRELEERIADWMGTSAALVCSSGYQANIALLQALATRHDRIYSDELNHASLIDGCRLAQARVRKVPHGNVQALEEALAEDAGHPGERFVLGEGLYSMDGDRGPVAEQAAVASRFGAWLLVDEAHAVGVLGPAGRGVCAEQGVSPLARVGTFGKALGSHGAFIATDAETRDLLVNAGRTYIFTTGLPPAAAGGAIEAIRIARSSEGDERRQRLLANARRVAEAATNMGLALSTMDLSAPGPIVPIVLGDADRALTVAAALLGAGIYVKAIRPPTVPAGACRLRITVCASHTAADIDLLIAALARSI